MKFSFVQQGGIKLVEELRTERKVKENFITEELAVLQSRLKGQVDEKEKVSGKKDLHQQIYSLIKLLDDSQ